MHVYQEEDGQIGLTFGIVLNQNDLSQIMSHNPLNIDVGPLRINISFCEPSKPVSFDINRRVYFVSLCYRSLRFLKNGNSLVAIHMIEEVWFTLSIFFINNAQNLTRELARKHRSYMLLRGSTLGR